ncbi:hypothetical protein CP02DC22_1082B, partial [Chlamydia psittaci 02DC22]
PPKQGHIRLPMQKSDNINLKLSLQELKLQ